MSEELIFNNKEAINLIIIFYTDPLGISEDEVDKYPEVKRFIEMGLVEKDQEHAEYYIASKAGLELLHHYIQNISNSFIKYMESKGYKAPCDDIEKWFKNEFDLETIEDAKDIVQYICDNLHNYGYYYNKNSSHSISLIKEF